MIRQIYIWRYKGEWPVHRSIEIETPLDTELPKYVTVLGKFFQRSGALFKGLHLYVEIEFDD